MWSYIMNKPKQGKDFHKSRNKLMNVTEDYDCEAKHNNTHPDLLVKEDRITLISEVLRKIMEHMTNDRENPDINHRSALDIL